MAAIQEQPVIVVACSEWEHTWAQGFFYESDSVFYVSAEDFHNQVTTSSMQDEPSYAHALVREIFEALSSISAPDLILFF